MTSQLNSCFILSKETFTFLMITGTAVEPPSLPIQAKNRFSWKWNRQSSSSGWPINSSKIPFKLPFHRLRIHTESETKKTTKRRRKNKVAKMKVLLNCTNKRVDIRARNTLARRVFKKEKQALDASKSLYKSRNLYLRARSWMFLMFGSKKKT